MTILLESGSIAKDRCYAFCHDENPDPNHQTVLVRRSVAYRAENPDHGQRAFRPTEEHDDIHNYRSRYTIYSVYHTIPYYFIRSRALHRISVIWKLECLKSFRSDQGAKIYADLHSSVATGRLNGRSALPAIGAALTIRSEPATS
jgi:hypothetical protein